MSTAAVPPTEILVTPLWLQALARSVDDPESEYRRIVDAREALGERHLPNAYHARQLALLGGARLQSRLLLLRNLTALGYTQSRAVV